MSSTQDWKQYAPRGAALWMRQKRLALDKARRAAEASENISVPVDVLRRKQSQLRGDAATTSADRRPLRIVTSKTATNTLLRWTSGVPARWLASLPLRVPPSEFDDLEVEPLDLELRQKVWLREKTARLVGRDATLALAQRAETDDDESAVLNAFAEAVETAGTLATEAAEELRDAREVAARADAGIAEVVRALQPVRRCAPTRRRAAIRRRHGGERRRRRRHRARRQGRHRAARARRAAPRRGGARAARRRG